MNKPVPSREQLAEILKSSATPDDKDWNIYQYLKANAGENLPSTEYRTLLLEYLRLGTAKPSLLHSLILSLALKHADTYTDFRIAPFVDLWGIANMRAEDFEQRRDEQGRTFHSLAERLGAAIMKYITANPAYQPDADTMRVATEQAARLGYMAALPMSAIKMFESEHEGRKMRMVKLVAADGTELSADWRMFRSKPWEIVGKIYTVLPRRAAKTGNIRVDTIGQSTMTPAQVFGSVVGYVDRYDDKHKHYHIFDSTSRHFVAEAPKLRIKEGDFVQFAPVVPTNDPFKSAIVISVMPKDEGRKAFGPVEAKVEFTNTEKGYFAYAIDGHPRSFANIKAATKPLKPGDTVSLIVYNRRGKDGEKRPFVGEAF